MMVIEYLKHSCMNSSVLFLMLLLVVMNTSSLSFHGIKLFQLDWINRISVLRGRKSSSLDIFMIFSQGRCNDLIQVAVLLCEPKK